MKKDIETIKKDLSEIKNVILEKNNMLEGVNSRLDEAEDLLSQWFGRQGRTKQPGKAAKRKKNFKKWGELKKHFRQHET